MDLGNDREGVTAASRFLPIPVQVVSQVFPWLNRRGSEYSVSGLVGVEQNGKRKKMLARKADARA